MRASLGGQKETAKRIISPTLRSIIMPCSPQSPCMKRLMKIRDKIHEGLREWKTTQLKNKFHLFICNIEMLNHRLTKTISSKIEYCQHCQAHDQPSTAGIMHDYITEPIWKEVQLSWAPYILRLCVKCPWMHDWNCTFQFLYNVIRLLLTFGEDIKNGAIFLHISICKLSCFVNMNLATLEISVGSELEICLKSPDRVFWWAVLAEFFSK